MLMPEQVLFLKQARKNILGLGVCVLLFLSGFMVHGNTGLYVNMTGFLIVIGGTLGAVFLSYRMNRIEILLKVLKTSYTTETKAPEEVVEILVNLAVKRRVRGVLSLQGDEDETTIAFLKQAIGLFVDGCSREQIRETLNAEMYFFRMRREETLRVLQTMADVAPSFGLIGSVVGLIGMLSGVGDSSVVMKMVPIALTSTLYGLVLANFLFLPFSANIRERTIKELFLKKIIQAGIIDICDELHPRLVERRLKSFLTPSARDRHFLTYKTLKAMMAEELKDDPEEASKESLKETI